MLASPTIALFGAYILRTAAGAPYPSSVMAMTNEEEKQP
jgi:hypothetical protein